MGSYRCLFVEDQLDQNNVQCYREMSMQVRAGQHQLIYEVHSNQTQKHKLFVH